MFTAEDIAAIPLFSGLPSSDHERVAQSAADVHLRPGEYAVHEGEERALFAVISGKIEVTKRMEGAEKSIGWRLPGTIFGEVPITLGASFPGSFRASEATRVLRIDARQYYVIAAAAPGVAVAVGALARERLGGLQGLAAKAPIPQVTVVGHRWDPACHDLRRFMARNQVVFDWLTPDSTELSARWPGWTPEEHGPALGFPDGTLVVRPPLRDVANRLGLQTAARSTEYDTIIVGGGPAGLAAAVYGASEGLRTVMVERETPGGQAGQSTRIENYLGFPAGVSGSDLARRATSQARRLGAELLSVQDVVALRPEGVGRFVELSGGNTLSSHCVLVASGVSYRKLDVPGFEALTGAGVSYGAAPAEARSCSNQRVVVIGGANSAGQAALYLSTHADRVTMLVRGPGLQASMSHYLVERLETSENVDVRTQTQALAAEGDGHLEALRVRGPDGEETLQADACFVFIGASPRTEWLSGVVARDERGFILAGPDVPENGWPLGRDPYVLETSVPGVFVAGDVRARSVKRVASAVGEGSMAVSLIHQYLADT